jgi:hypothetical protein
MVIAGAEAPDGETLDGLLSVLDSRS